MQFIVFHDGGYHEPTFEVTCVEANNAQNAAKKVLKKLHHNNGDWEFFVCPR